MPITCLIISIDLLLLLTIFNLYYYLKPQKVLGVSTLSAKETELASRKAYWEDLLSQSPTYLDGWLELAKIELVEGDKVKATEYLNKARDINPNSEKIKRIENYSNL